MGKEETDMTKTENFRDRARGAMYGVAAGDALGAPLEFMDAIEER